MARIQDASPHKPSPEAVEETGRDVMRAILAELTPPVDLDRDHWRGGERAAVTLVEYGDYECPYSRMAFRAIQRLEPQLGGQLRFVFRHLPLTRIHPHALVAAHWPKRPRSRAASGTCTSCCSTTSRPWTDADLWRYADQLGLDRHRLAADLDGRTVWQRVQADTDSALASGARGTPTLFINGQRHRAGYDQATLRAALAAASTER